MGILKQAEGGVPVSELCGDNGMSSAAFMMERTKFGGMHCTVGYRTAMSREWMHL